MTRLQRLQNVIGAGNFRLARRVLDIERFDHAVLDQVRGEVFDVGGLLHQVFARNARTPLACGLGFDYTFLILT